MARLEDDYREEEIQKLREAMEQLHQHQLERKKMARQAYEAMKRRDPECWKAFSFATDVITP